MRPVFQSAGGLIRRFLLTVLLTMPAALAQTPVTKILPLGDSITRGNNDVNFPNGDIPGGYRKELGNKLNTAGLPFDFVGTQTDNAASGMDPDHSGMNGFRTDQVLENLPASLALAPDVVLLHLGTNDILQSIPVTTAAANLDTLISRIVSNAPNRKLYVSTIIPFAQGWGVRTAAQLNADGSDLNTRLRNLVRQHADLGEKVFLVDMNTSIVLTDPDPSKNFFLAGDGIHPGQAGYIQMAAIWFRAIAPSLSDTIVNGSFELGFTGWASSGQVLIKSGVPYTPTDGTKLAAFHPQESATNGVLSQVFPTVAGTTYELAFDLAGTDDAAGQRLQATLKGTAELASQTISVTGANGGGIAWTPQSLVFVADGANTSVTFTDRSTTGNSTGLLLDHIRLIKRPSPVAETPNTWTALRAHPQNSHILEFRGRPTVLRTFAEHYSSVINSDFDFVPYLNTQQRDGMNLTRAFLVGFRHDGSVFPATPLAPAPARFLQPWLRSGTTGPALDGLGKWDFTTWNEEYFTRLRNFAGACSERGVVAEFTLFCTPYTHSDWRVSPFNPANNVRGNGPANRYDALRGIDASLMAAQEAAVRRIVSELNEFDNIYFEILNEPFWNEPGVKDEQEIAFQNRMLQVIRETEAALPNKHLVAHNFPQQADAMSPGFEVINEHYPLAVSVQGPNPAIAGAEALLRDHYQRDRILALDETDTTTALQTRLESWMFLLGGGGIYNGLDVPYFVYSAQDETGDTELGRSFRKGVRDIGSYMDNLDLAALRRDLSWVTAGIPNGSTLQAMASQGQQYVAYFHHGQHELPEGLSYNPIDSSNHVVTAVVALPTGSWRVVWTRPSDLTVLRTEEFTHTGGSRTLAAVTYQEDVALRIDRTGAGDLTPPPGPTGLGAASDASGAIRLTWNPVQALDLANYQVYRSPGIGVPLDTAHRISVVAGNRTDYTDTTTIPGTTYHYVITAVDLSGNESIASAETPITSTLDNIPYGGTARQLPGTIEAENFDNGGEGVASHDLTGGNEGGQYRPSENVDIAATTDQGGGYQIFETQAGEWLEYSVNATKSGKYILELRVANPQAGGRVRLEADGVDVSGNVEIPPTAGWQTVNVPDILLSSGPHILRLTVSATSQAGTAGAINWFSLSAGPAVGPTASAGPDLQISDQDNSGSEAVSLSAASSLPGDAPIQTYTWLKNGIVIASGPKPTVALAVGNHLIKLKLTDGNSLESTDEILVAVRPGGFVNGSFETGYTGWTTTGNQAIQSGAPYAATDGTKLVGFNGANLTPNAVLSQTFATIPGGTYSLAFDAGVLSFNTSSQTMQVTATGNTNLLNRTITIAGLGGGSNRWLAQGFTFVADRNTTTLAFRDLSTATINIDLLLDNVRVSGPPPVIPNTAPFAVADAYSTNEGQALVVPAGGVLANDSDVDANPLTAVLNASPKHGTLILNSVGGFTYTPATGFFGSDSFTYHANDGTADSNINTVSINVIEVVPAPLAVADFYAIDQNTALVAPTTGVLTNDSDARGRALTAVLDEGPAHGSLILNPNGTFDYTPVVDYFGTDSFTYHANNGVLKSGIVTAAITINEIIPAPIAEADSYSTDQNTALVVPAAGVLANDSDPRSRILTALLDQGPVHGSLVLNTNGSFIYTPSENYFGPDSFTYHANNGSRDSSVVTVNITLTVNGMLPDAIALADSYSIHEGGTLSVPAAGVLSNDTEVNSLPLTAAINASPAHGILTLDPDGGFTYIPSGNYFGSDSFSYHANNGTSDSNITTVELLVTEVVPPPVAVVDAYTTNQNAVLVIPAAGLLSNDSDPRSRPLTAVLDLTPGNGTVTVDAGGGFIYSPATGFFGTDSFTYQAHNGTLASESATVTLTVNEVIPPPLAAADSYTTAEGIPLIVPAAGVLINDTDPRSHPLTAVLDREPTHGTLTLDADGGFQYRPAAGFFGTDSFTYRASNGGSASEIKTVSLTVTEVIPAPVAVADAYQTDASTPLVAPAAGVLLNDSDLRLRPLTAVLDSAPANGTLVLNRDGGFTYSPASGFSGSDAFTYHSRNGFRDSTTATVSLTIRPPAPVGLVNGSFESGLTGWTSTGNLAIQSSAPYAATEGTKLVAFNIANQAPNAVLSQSFGTIAGQSYTLAFDLGVLAYNTSPQTMLVTVNGATNLLSRTLTITGAGNGTNRWLPQSFTFVANGSTATLAFRDQSSSTVNLDMVLDNVRVTGVTNTAPFAAADSYQAIRETALVVPAKGVLANDSDSESNALTTILSTSPAHGTLALNANGGFTYTPAVGYTGADSFSYLANDGLLNSNVATVTLTVIPPPPNTAPVAVADSYSTTKGTALTVPTPGILANDTDAESSPLTAALVSGPANGTLTLTANGGFTYTPAAGFTGSDSFTYRAHDGDLYSNAATVTITVIDIVPGTLINGSFEAGFSGWTTNGNQSIQSAAPYTSTDGIKLVAFNAGNSSPNAVLSQSFPTAAGQSYSLAFDVGVLAFNTNSQTLQVSVTGSSSLLSRTINLNGAGNGSNRWVPQSFTFTANSSTTVLAFRDQSISTEGLDLTLDNVRLSAVASPPNTAPAAIADSYSTVRDIALVVPAAGVLSNDTDSQSDPLTALLNAVPTHGTVVIAANGGFTYTPAAGYTGADSFTYHANDGRLDSNIVTVTLSVTAPVATTLVNGSFESGFTGWVTTGNQGIQSAAPYAASDGTKLVAFNGGNQTPNGTLSQAFATNAGQSYILAFDAGVLAFNSATQTLQVTVNGSASLLSRTITLFGTGSGASRWQAQTFTFVAESSSATLTFRDQSATTSNLDLLLDNVRITSTPPLAIAAAFPNNAVAPVVPVPQAIVAPPVLPPGGPSISGTPGNISVSMTASSPGTYSLESSPDLVTWEWIIQKQAAAGDQVEFRDTRESTAPAMFYRIGFLPASLGR